VSAADVQAFAREYLAGREPLVAVAKAAGAAQASAAAGAQPSGHR
jgi:hypothetical protein